MNLIKKTLLILLFMPVILSAGYVVDRVTIFTGQVVITGNTNITALRASIYNRFSHTPTNVITWSNINLPLPGGTKWRIANQYVKVVYTNFKNYWGISLGTDNKNPSIARPLYTGSADSAGGLIGTVNSNQVLQMVWQVQDNTNDYKPPRISDPVTIGGATYFTNTGWAWKFFIDQASANFTNTSNNDASMGNATVNYYVTCVNQAGRLWGSANSERGACDSPVYIYFAANFASASVQRYKTTTITLEMFHP